MRGRAALSPLPELCWGSGLASPARGHGGSEAGAAESGSRFPFPAAPGTAGVRWRPAPHPPGDSRGGERGDRGVVKGHKETGGDRW